MPEIEGMSGAYHKYGTSGADKEVRGLDGDSHDGTDFFGPEGTPIRAFTDGTVTWVGYSDTGGHMISIRDVGGDIHTYKHMRDPSPYGVGDEIMGGDLIGHIGPSHDGSAPHLHYQIMTSDGSAVYNPHTFFKWRDGSSNSAPYGPIDFTGQLSDGNIWNSHKNKTGVSKFMQTAFDAGLTGPEVATVTSTGIWEDGGEKLWGTKSLLNTTYDSNGQAARGIMNWVDPNVDYGDTVAEQLQYIQRVYFDGASSDFRAKVRNTGYDQQDLSAYNAATGRHGWKLDYGENYGPYMNEEDLIEGSEHFFRGALVPACIHTVEGPRKYIGTAVGVYNWLLDEGYIDNYGEAADINYNTGYSEPTEVSALASNAYYNTTSTTDKTSGVPSRYTAEDSGKTGVAYNAADQKLFEYYIPTHNTNADKWWIDKHKYISHIANFGNGKFIEIYIDTNSFPLTTAGANAKKLVNQYSSDDKIPKTNANTPGIISTKLSDSDIRTIWKSFYSSYSDKYVSGLSRDKMISEITSRKHNGLSLYYDTSDGNLYYKDYRSAGRITVSNGGFIYWPDISPVQQNNGTNVANNPSSSFGTSTTTVTTASQQAANMQSLSEYLDNENRIKALKSSVYGNGDVSQIFGGTGMTSQLTGMFSIDPYLQNQASPVVVNNYAVNSTGDDVIDALMSNTYNIRSAEIESLLAGMLKMMKDRKNKKQSSSSQTRTSKQSKQDAAFPEQGIPRQVQRLSIG